MSIVRSEHQLSSRKLLTALFLAMLMTFAPSVALADDVPPVSRGQWIHQLVQTFDVTVEDENYPEEYFSDVESSSPYYQDLVKAVEFGIIDVPAGGEVRADDAATREFAAHTLNFCLGFQLQEEQYSFSDAEDCEHPSDDQVAVDHGWFELVEGRFEPEREVTTVERDAAFADAAEVWHSTDLEEGHENVVEFEDGVKVIPEGTQIEEPSEGTFAITDCPVSLAKGDTFAAYFLGIPNTYTVSEVSVSGSVTTVVTEQVEAYEELDYQGVAELDMSAFEVPGDAVPTRTKGGVQASPKFELYYGDRTLTGKAAFTVGSGNTKGSADLTVKASNLNMETKFKSDSSTVIVTGDLSVKGQVGGAFTVTIPVAKMSIAGVGSVGLDLTEVVSGEAYAEATSTFRAGFQVTRDDVRIVKDFSKKSFTCKAKASLTQELKLSAGINLVVAKGEVFAKVGTLVKAEVETIPGAKPETCTTFVQCITASAGATASVDLGIYKREFSKIYTLWDQSNSPVRLYYHYEDGVLVEKCTRGGHEGDYTTGSGSRSAYRYGGGGPLGSLTDGLTTGATYEISKSTTLSRDVHLVGNLIVSADLDLAGHALTVTGDLEHRSGILAVDRGRLSVGGSYLARGAGGGHSSGMLFMARGDDVVEVAGDAVFNCYNDGYSCGRWSDAYRYMPLDEELSAGEIRISGDLVDEYGTFQPMGTRVVLEGEGVQSIDFQNTQSSLYDVVDESGAGVAFPGLMIIPALRHDLAVSGDALLLTDMDLNGHALTVTGDLEHRSGILAVDRGRLSVGGSYLARGAGGGHSSGMLFMAKGDDVVEVAGDAVFNCYNDGYSCGRWSDAYRYMPLDEELSAGEIRISGDLVDEYGTFQPMGTRVVLEGEGVQSIDFRQPSSLLAELAVEDGTSVSLARYLRFGKPLKRDLTITGDAEVYYDLDLAGHKLTVTGDLEHSGGQITLGHGELSVGGDYLLRAASGTASDGSTTYGASYGNFNMKWDDDVVKVAGNALFNCSGNYLDSELAAGTICVAGSLTDANGKLQPTGTKVVMNGKALQTIDFKSTSTRLAKLGFADGAKVQVTKYLGLGTLSDDLSIIGDVEVANSLALAGHTLRISGNLLQTSGELSLARGTLDVGGNYRLQSVSTNSAGGISYGSCSSTLSMSYAKDKVFVGGDFVCQSNYTNDSYLKFGTLHVFGAFLQPSTDSSYRFYPADGFLVVLDGDARQDVQFATSSSRFASLRSDNPRGVRWAGWMTIGSLESDLSVEAGGELPEGLQMNGTTCLNGHTLSIDGDLRLRPDSEGLQLKGGTFSVSGTLAHSGGGITFEKGRVVVGGDYRMQVPSIGPADELVFGSGSNATLSMLDPDDTVSVGGSFVFQSSKNHNSTYLNAGTLEVAGDFTDLSSSYFRPAGTHLTVLNGTKVQRVTFPNATDKFNRLKLTQPRGQYVFSPDNCWKELVENPVTALTLSEDSVTLTSKGETRQLAVTIVPESATYTDVTWQSSDESVATVEGGLVTAVKNGTATITVKSHDEKVSATCVVVVSIPHVPGEPVRENEVAATCTEGGSYDLVTRCTLCNEVLESVHYEVGELGHDYVATTVEPTWDEGGYMLHVCSRCDDDYVDNETVSLREAEEAKVADVVAAIDALPDPPALSDAGAVEAARAVYDALDQRVLVLVTNLGALEAAEARIADLQAVAAVDEAIAALPAVGDLTLDGADEVAEARAAYDALTDARKALVINLAALEAAEGRVEDLSAAAAVDARIAGLPGTDDLDLSHAPDVAAARSAYESLTEGQQALVGLLDDLEAAEARIAELQAQSQEEADAIAAASVDEAIANLPAWSELTAGDVDAVGGARQLYDALTDDQKTLVTKLGDLEADEERVADLIAAAEVEAAITGLPACDDLALSDAEMVDSARTAYTALTETQKGLVSNLADLEAAEARIFALQQAHDNEVDDLEAARDVTYAIVVLSPDDADAVAAAREAYEALTEDQRVLVPNYADLVAAEAHVAWLALTPIDGATVTVPAQTYTGKALTPKPKVTLGGATLVQGSDYTVAYANNKNVGKGTVTIEGKGGYRGAIKATFTIGRAAQTITASNKECVTGKTISLGAKRTVGNGKLTYKTSNAKVATVSSTGVVKGVKAGKVTITITAAQTTNYKSATKKVTVKVGKANPVTAKASKGTVTASFSTLKSKAVTLASNVKVSKAQGKVTYANASTNATAKKFKVNASNGKLTVPKGTKKGKYQVVITVKAAGNGSYISATKTVKFYVQVK